LQKTERTTLYQSYTFLLQYHYFIFVTIGTLQSRTHTHTHNMDDYPAADPIPEPSGDIDIDGQYTTLMEYLSNSREMRHVAKSSFQQALWSGAGAMAGGLCFGPIGGLVGGVTGSLVGFAKTPQYDGIILQISKLDEHSQKMLMKKVGQVLVAAGAATQSMTTQDAFRDALMAYASSREVREGIWNACLETLHQ
jgi:hypothetical protein